jgi:hypothetical protein
MATTILIIGESGTGKSTSIRTLDPKETYIINVLDKPLPFRGWKKNYQKTNGEPGNLYASDNCLNIIKCLKHINDNLPHIRSIIIDDFQYVMGNEFMRRALEKGWDKFPEIQKGAWDIIMGAQACRSDLDIFVLSHSETDATGKTKCKTIGKMLDEKICFEGMFTMVFSSVISDENYYFQTRNDGFIMGKTPMDMFEDKLIPNDLQLVKQTIDDYFEGDIEQ